MTARAVALSITLAVLAACGRSEPAPRAMFWSCDGVEFALTEQPGESLRVQLPGRDTVLDEDANADDRFAGGGLKLRFIDDGAVLDVDGARYSCGPKVWDAGPAAFRALGQEPGWHLEVVPGGRLTLAFDYGERTLTAPAPPPAELDGGARGYQAPTADGALILVVVEPLVCFDSMSGEVYPETVTVAVGDQRYRGCGAQLH